MLYKKLGDLETALQLWLDLYYSTENPEEQKIAQVYILHIKMELDLQHMNEKIQEFIENEARLPSSLRELVAYGYLDSIPTEPHGERFVIRDGKAQTTWRRDKLRKQ